eukprot:490514_1
MAMNTYPPQTFKQRGLTILLSLGMNANDNTLDELFGPSTIKSFEYNSDEIRLQRLKFVLKIYELWINLQKQKQNVNVNIYDLFKSYLPHGYSFMQILIDFKHIIKNKEILGYDNDGVNNMYQPKQNECNISTCYVSQRHEREKNYYGMNKKTNNELFFIENNNNNNDYEADQKLIVIQDMLDTMHYYIDHCIRVD